MGDWLRVDESGEITREAHGHGRLGARPGRFAVVPSAPDLLLAIRLPAQGGPLPQGRVLLCGDLAGTSFPDLVGLLVQGRKSGVLRVLSRTGDRTLVFAEGELRGASSTHPGDRLGEIAVRLGFLERDALDRILAGDPAGRRLGRRLVEEGLMTAPDVWRAVQEQVASIFHSILLGETGLPFVFTDEPVEAIATAPALPAQGLLLDGLRRLDELSLFRKRIPSGDVRVRPGRPAETILSVLEQQLVTEVGKAERSVEDLSTMLRVPEFEVIRALYHLAEAGLVVLTLPGARSLSGIPPPGGELQPVIRSFNQIFREIGEAFGACGMETELRAAVSSALAGPKPVAPLLAGVIPAPDGSLPEGELMHRAGKVEKGNEALLAALQELMFFLLFTAGEHLEARQDEELNRRVKLIFGMLSE